MRNTKLFLLLIVFFISFQSPAQRTGIKNPYDANYDSINGKNAYLIKNSNNGNWVLMKEVFDGKTDVYKLINIKKSRVKRFENAAFHSFSEDNLWFAYLDITGTLTLVNLLNDKEYSFENITKLAFDHTSQYLCLIEKKKSDSKLLLIQLETRKLKRIPHIQNFSVSPDDSFVVLNRKEKELILYDLKKNEYKPLIKAQENSVFGELIWNQSGDTFLTLEKNENSRIHLYKDGRLSEFSDVNLKNSHYNFMIDTKYPISLSEDGSKIFFYRKQIGNHELDSKQTNDLETWDTSDRWIHPKLKNYENYALSSFVTLWNTKDDSIHFVTDSLTPSCSFNADLDYALVYDKLQFEPSFEQYPHSDIFIKHFSNESKELVVANQYINHTYFSISPSGRFITYFKEEDWWLYDTKVKSTKNLTDKIPYPVVSEQFSHPYGNPGWSMNEEYFIVYDKYDIWLVSIKDGSLKKLTDGRVSKIKYRINTNIHRNDLRYLKSFTTIKSNLDSYKRPVLLNMTGEDLNTGLALWENDRVRTLVYRDKIIEDALLNQEGDLICYKESKYNSAPELFVLHTKNNLQKKIYSNNPRFNELSWKKEEIFEFTDSTNLVHKTLILFPVNYDAKKKYPMIVKIYESISIDDIGYLLPSDYHEIGFNINNYLLNGYIILIPKINYKLGSPGISALNSLLPIVKKVISKYSVDEKKIGLMGHSFGGYETEFIITQTDIFAAAVAGAAVSDLTSYYHDISWGTESEQIWRMENQQFRMGLPYYQSKKNYRENSAINYVENLKTPLLIWTGKEDSNTNWYQSIYMFNAMRRLGKNGKLLLFENEPHVLSDPLNQQKLSIEIFNWFNDWLK